MSFTELTEDNHTKGQTDNTPDKLTFRIVDSPMGIGKSSSRITIENGFACMDI